LYSIALLLNKFELIAIDDVDEDVDDSKEEEFDMTFLFKTPLFKLNSSFFLP
jgi:hypothetical protein